MTISQIFFKAGYVASKYRALTFFFSAVICIILILGMTYTFVVTDP